MNIFTGSSDSCISSNVHTGIFFRLLELIVPPTVKLFCITASPFLYTSKALLLVITLEEDWLPLPTTNIASFFSLKVPIVIEPVSVEPFKLSPKTVDLFPLSMLLAPETKPNSAESVLLFLEPNIVAPKACILLS